MGYVIGTLAVIAVLALIWKRVEAAKAKRAAQAPAPSEPTPDPVIPPKDIN